MARFPIMKRWYVAWVGLLIIAPAIAFGSGRDSQVVTLEIPSAITVNGSQICLSDLGVVRGGPAGTMDYFKKVELGPVPAPGQQRILNRDYLTSLIQQYHFPFTLQLQMDEAVVVTSSAACIEGKDIEKAIQSLVTEKNPRILKRWVELRNVPENIFLNPGEWKIEASPIGNQAEVGAALFEVVLSKGSESRVLNISGKIRATALVYRALRDISYQSVLNSADFELVQMELGNGKEFLGDIQSGLRSTKLIKQGEILRKDWFQPVPFILKDQEVKVMVKDENVAINILGIAKTDGWLGDEIMIINPLSRKFFKARVTGKGIVELNLQ